MREALLTHLAVVGKVSASTQNQALSALLFLYQQVLNIDLPFLDDITRAKRPKHIPTILKGTSKNLASLVFSLPNFTFLPEGSGFINKLHVFFRTPFLHTLVLRKQKPPTQWVFRGAPNYTF
jgi:hypothetical protein